MNQSDSPTTVANPRAVPEDDALLGDYRASRSEGAFQQIVRRHGAMVFRTCRRLVANDAEAEDASQAVFLLLAQRPQAVRSCLAAWLHWAARNVAYKIVRARQRRLRHEQQGAQMRAAASAPDQRLELREELDAALSQLPIALREIVILRYLEGHSQDETARILGCPQGTLAWRAKQGLDTLRTILKRRGAVVSTSVLLGVLAQEAQASLSVLSLVPLKLEAARLGATNSTAALLAESVWHSLFWAKVQKAACLAVALLALTAGIPAAAYLMRDPAGPSANATAVAPLPDGPPFRVLADAEEDQQDNSMPEGVLFTPDGRSVVAGRSDGTIKTWDRATGALRACLTGHTDHVGSLTFSTSGRLLASGSHDGSARLWDLAAGKCLHILVGHTQPISTVAFTPDGRTLASSSWDSTIKLWETNTGRCTTTLPVGEGTQAPAPHRVWTAVFAPDGRTLVASDSGGRVRVWDVVQGRCRATLLDYPRAGVMKLAVAPDGRTLAVPTYDKGVFLFDVATWTKRDHIPFGAACAIAFAPDGRTLAITGQPVLPPGQPGPGHWATIVWDLAARRERGRFQQNEHCGGLSVAYAPDGQMLAVAHAGTVTLLNAAALTPAFP